MREWTVIGVPTSAGAHHAGQEQAPAALREAGLIERLREAGLSVADAGDLQEPRSRRITIIPVRATLPRWPG